MTTPDRLTDDDRYYIAEARRLRDTPDPSDYALAYLQARIVLEKLADLAERLAGGNAEAGQ